MAKLNKQHISYGLATLMFVTILANCQATPVFNKEVTPTFITSTVMIKKERDNPLIIVPTSSPTVTIMPTESATITVARTKTPMPTSTWTPIPTLNKPEARAFINKMLTRNADCELPCVWGIIPGQTKWYEAQQFLQSFLDYKGQVGASSGSMKVDYEADKSMGDIKIEISVKNQNINGFYLPSPGTKVRYRLDQILTRYGEPEKAYINTYPDTPVRGLLPFDLILYYPNFGFSALFNYNAAKIGNHIQVCPSKQPIGPNLVIWDPQTNYPLEEIYPEYFETGTIPTLNLIEALGIDLAQFTNTFKYQNAGICFVTQNDLWQ